MKSQLFIVVPVFNEASNIQRLVEAFHDVAAEFGPEYHVRFVLVDDGSTDGTGALAEQLSEGLDFMLLTHDVNQGPGRAFGTAFEHLASRLKAEDWVITMEGDNTSRHELIRQMLTRTKEGYEIVLASPYMYGGGILQTAPFRVFLSHMSNLLVKEVLGIHGIMTMSSFFRLYQGHALLDLQAHYGPRVVERRGFECMVEMLLKMIYLKFHISEVPMVLNTSRRVGGSKMKIVKTIRGYLTLLRDQRRWRKASLTGQTEAMDTLVHSAESGKITY